MHAVNDEVETIHLYVVREPEKQPSTALPLLCACLCLAGIVVLTLYSGEHPYYAHERLAVPAIFLPLKVFTATAPIVPTGVKTYPATHAEGTLTLANGSVLSETLPAGILFSASQGIEVQTAQAVSIPAGSAAGYGVATVRARAVQAGTTGNLPAFAVNAVYGTALYVRNLAPFSGGQNAYTVPVLLPKDRQTALNAAAATVAAQQARVAAVLTEPCTVATLDSPTLVRTTWTCRYAVYQVPSYMRVIAARLSGKQFLVDVAFIPPPARVVVR